MLEALKPLLDSDLVNEDTRKEIQEAWDSKLVEIQEQAKTDLREEFAKRYEQDKAVMVEALEKLVNESLTSDIKEIVKEKKALAEDRVKYNTKMREAAKRLDKFVMQKLSEEIVEFRKELVERKVHLGKLDKFIISSLAEEITEFNEDKKDLASTKVRLVTEARGKLENVQKVFVKKSAKLVKETITKKLQKELGQLKEDIQLAKENDFGRKIFEAYVAEFSVSHLNENKEIVALQKQIAEKDTQISQARDELAGVNQIVESKDHQIRQINERKVREKVMSELLTPLSKNRAQVMADLLESVPTKRLEQSFKKYLPSIMGDNKPARNGDVLKESTNIREVTGDKPKTIPEEEVDIVSNILHLSGMR
tara:strand:- start:172 stop:1269 length:1098 start_codon:yes stop_codon:yes gene_type:complete